MARDAEGEWTGQLGTCLARYTYDALGRRVMTHRNPGQPGQSITRHVYGTGAAVVAEYSVNPSTSEETALRWFVHGEGFPEPLAMVDLSAAGDNPTPGAEELLYYLTDVQGSVGALTNAVGQVVERYFYTPYGQTTITAADGTTPRTESLYGNPFAYTAQRYKPQTGLYHFWARVYSPTLGRWLQKDMQGPLAVVDVLFRSNGHHPIIMLPFAGASAEYRDTLNLFLYALASPAVHQDPFGLSVALWVAERFLDATGGDDSWLDDQEFVQKLSMGFGIAGAAALGGAFIIAAAPAIVTAAQSFQMAIATASGGGGAALLSRWPGPAGGRQIINGITYTVHALERMAPYVYGGRGVPPSVVENAIRFGSRTAGSSPGTLQIVYENVVVITNAAADLVITVMKLGH